MQQLPLSANALTCGNLASSRNMNPHSSNSCTVQYDCQKAVQQHTPPQWGPQRFVHVHSLPQTSNHMLEQPDRKHTLLQVPVV